jgi:hypothetical protein
VNFAVSVSLLDILNLDCSWGFDYTGEKKKRKLYHYNITLENDDDGDKLTRKNNVTIYNKICIAPVLFARN